MLFQAQTVAEQAEIVQTVLQRNGTFRNKNVLKSTEETVQPEFFESDIGKNVPGDHTDLYAITRTPFYFGSDTDSLFGWYHAPIGSAENRSGIVICPPIGYEYIHSHRSLRHLADQLASAGIPTIRFDYHGTGDSAGVDEDQDRVSAWLDSIQEAVNALKKMTGCTEVGLVGLRMGATLAAMLAEETNLMSLVLWAPCISGQQYVQEMKDLHYLSTLRKNDSSPAHSDIDDHATGEPSVYRSGYQREIPF